jgi:hypothetical protein
MGFIKLNRHAASSGCVFDAATVVEKARQVFPGIQVLPGDPLELSVERATQSTRIWPCRSI